MVRAIGKVILVMAAHTEPGEPGIIFSNNIFNVGMVGSGVRGTYTAGTRICSVFLEWRSHPCALQHWHGILLFGPKCRGHSVRVVTGCAETVDPVLCSGRVIQEARRFKMATGDLIGLEWIARHVCRRCLAEAGRIQISLDLCVCAEGGLVTPRSPVTFNARNDRVFSGVHVTVKALS